MSKNKDLIPKRKLDSNKSDYGRVLLIAGSNGMLGSGILATRAALRSGSGLVYWAVPKELVNPANISVPEAIIKNYDELKIVKPNVVAVGPGLTTSNIALRNTHYALQSFACPLVIDADALNIISKDPKMLTKLPKNCVLTPHPLEMARLIGLSVEDIQGNRIKIAKEYANRWNVVLVLKGHHTVVADPSGKTYVNKTGNPGMATAGMGDVLTGIIASFIGQNISVFDAARLAVYCHGLAGDMCAKDKGEYGIIASDIVEYIPKAILKVQKNGF